MLFEGVGGRVARTQPGGRGASGSYPAGFRRRAGGAARRERRSIRWSSCSKNAPPASTRRRPAGMPASWPWAETRVGGPDGNCLATQGRWKRCGCDRCCPAIRFFSATRLTVVLCSIQILSVVAMIKIVSWNLLRLGGRLPRRCRPADPAPRSGPPSHAGGDGGDGRAAPAARRSLPPGLAAGPGPWPRGVEPGAAARHGDGAAFAVGRHRPARLPGSRCRAIRGGECAPFARAGAEPAPAPPHRRGAAAPGGDPRRLQPRRADLPAGLPGCRAA